MAGNFFTSGPRHSRGSLRPLDRAPDDDRLLGAHPVAVLQYDLLAYAIQFRTRSRWRDDPGQWHALHRLGVSAAGFEGTDPGFPNKVFVPHNDASHDLPGAIHASMTSVRSWFYLSERLKPGVTLDQAQAS